MNARAFPLHRLERQASALVLVLFILAIMTILMVGFVISMKTERMAAAAMAGNERAKIIAQNALEHATALLDNNIPQPIAPGQAGVPQNWIVSPGLLTKYPGADGSSPTYVPLSSNTNSDPSIAPETDYANLNAQQLSTSDYPIIPTGEPVKASWVYLTQNPAAPASATNPVIGRYAFWMDDENTRINISTAYGKPTTIRDTPVGGNYPYLNRSNPLDRSTNNAYTWGSAGYDPDVGFNSLVGLTYTGINSGTTDPTVYQINAYKTNFPGASTNVANGVGSPKAISGNPTTTRQRFYPLWHPSAVNIDILPTSLSDSTSIGNSLDKNGLSDWTFNPPFQSAGSASTNGYWRVFQAPDQVKSFVSSNGGNAFYQANKFNLTSNGRAPEFNAFGKPRLLMESRIQTKGAGTSAANTAADTNLQNKSGTELAFYTTPDFDAQGPSYFHGSENISVYTGAGTYYPDIAAVQMVGDYLSTLLNRSDWPGMPASSFASKWQTGGLDPSDTSVGLREADQVAWNIVALGNYASNIEPTTTGDWPDDYNVSFMKNTLACVKDTRGTAPAVGSSYETNYEKTVSGNVPPSAPDPNLSLRVGKLSGKAIMPYSPKPYVNEVGLQVTVIPADPSGTTAALSGVFYLKFSLQVELYAAKRGPPGSFWGFYNLQFALTHFFYTVQGISGSTGLSMTTQQGATALPCNGDAGASDGYGTTFKGLNHTTLLSSPYAFAACLSGGTIDPPITNPTDPGIVFPINTYMVMATTLPNSNGLPGKSIYVCQPNTSAMQYEALNANANPPTTVGKAQAFKGTVHIQAKTRLFVYAGSQNTQRTWEIVPIWDKVNNNLPAMNPPGSQTDSLSWDFNLDLSTFPTTGAGTSVIRSVEVTDPRLGGNSLAWRQYPGNSSGNTSYTDVGHSLGAKNQAAITAGFDEESDGYFDFQNSFYANSPRPSIGFLSMVPTGMQRGIVNSTLSLGPNPDKSKLPDWLLLDLLAPSFMDTSQPTPAPYSYLHSTMGKINLNSQIYPKLTSSSGAAITRDLPLEALFKNMVPDSALPALAANIRIHALTTGGNSYGAPNQYDYIGELCEISGIADGTYTPGGASGTKWQKEALIRNLVNLMTVQSNSFRVWGAAQSIKLLKKTGNTDYGVLETGDTVTVLGEKRFESTVERSVWPGVDGVPGNGHSNTNGVYDQKSTSSSDPFPVSLPWAGISISKGIPASGFNWAQFDGPDNPNTPRQSTYPVMPGWYGSSTTQPLLYSTSKLGNAVNPARAHMVYRPILFRYQTE